MKTIVKIFLAAALTGAAAIPALAYEAALEFQTRVSGRASQEDCAQVNHLKFSREFVRCDLVVVAPSR